jgi:hypothetical protein
MLRISILLLALTLAQPAWVLPTWAQSAPVAPASTAKPAAPKPAKPKPTPMPTAAPLVATSRPCIGVIPVVSLFVAWKFKNAFRAGQSKASLVWSWGLDDLVVARVRAAAGPRFTVRRIAISPDMMAALDKLRGGLLRESEDEFSPLMQKAAGSAGCERYVLVTRGAHTIGGGYIRHAIRGLSLINTNTVLDSQVFIFALTQLRVFDGKTFAVIARGIGQTNKEDLMSQLTGKSLTNGPNRELVGFAWPDNIDATLTPAVRDATRALLAESLDATLPDMLRR